jgi:membrane protein DedA with SNARE-associated domain
MMETLIEFLIQHGYLVLFAWVLLDQLALPMPAIPIMLGAGALAGLGHLDVTLCIAIVVVACLPSDVFWYWLGIRQGNKVLTLLCILSLEPDSCVSGTTRVFERYGTASLLIAKFVPGLQTIAPPVAGLLGVGAPRFILLDTLGALLYALAFILPGFWFHDLIVQIAESSAQFGSIVALVLAGGLAGYVAYKWSQRRKFLRSLRGARMDPEELHERLSRGEDVQVVDLRQRLEFNSLPQTIPGAIRACLDQFEECVAALRPERPIVLFCT